MQDIMIAGTKSAFIPDPAESMLVPPQVYEICVHVRDLSDLITPMVESFHGETKSITYTCEVCDTDAVIEIAPFGSKMALIMTRWVNLGCGLTQDDILWSTHVDSIRARIERVPDYLHTTPRLCFEDIAPETFEELRARNLCSLRNKKFHRSQQYQTVMSSTCGYAGGYVWYIWYKVPSRKRVRIIHETLKSLLDLLFMDTSLETASDPTLHRFYPSFLRCHGQPGVEGNGIADTPANTDIRQRTPDGTACEESFPTHGGTRSLARQHRKLARQEWWGKAFEPFSKWYKDW
ncbi:hypothetical protein N7528_008711 [Penicillium herquei]|nr:hypothetical protein N7528_008711 [Penicillium herquei]